MNPNYKYSWAALMVHLRFVNTTASLAFGFREIRIQLEDDDKVERVGVTRKETWWPRRRDGRPLAMGRVYFGCGESLR